MTCRTSCWRSITPPTSAGASCRCTRRGASRRCGCWCRRPAATRRRPAGVTIHRLEDDRYELVGESVAFPGWSTTEIHVALTEPLTTERTCRVLERVGRTLGAREGTGPQDDPLLRVLGDRERAEGEATGRAEGKAAGRAEGHAELVRAMLAERGDHRLRLVHRPGREVPPTRPAALGWPPRHWPVPMRRTSGGALAGRASDSSRIEHPPAVAHAGPAGDDDNAALTARKRRAAQATVD